MIATADLVFWAIEFLVKSGVPEGASISEDSPRKFSLPPNLASLGAAAKQYAEKLETSLDGIERLNRSTKPEAHRRSDTSGDRKRTEVRLVQLYLSDLHAGRIPETKPSDREWVGIAALRHWEKMGLSLPHPLQRQARALVEATIHLWHNERMAPRDFARFGPSIRALLRGLDTFAVEETAWDPLVVSFYCRALDAIVDQAGPELELPPAVIEQITAELASSLVERLAGLKPGEAQASLEAIVPLLLGSVLLALRQEARDNRVATYLSTLLDRRIAPAFLGLMTEASEEGFAKTIAAFTPLTLSRLVKASVRLVHQFPHYFLESTESFQLWLRQLLSDLFHPGKEGHLVEPDLLAETACQVLESGLEDLPLLARHPSSKQLFVVITLRSLLEVLVEARPSGELRARLIFSRSDTVSLIAAVIGAWRSHPEWLLKRAGHQERAATLIPLLVHSLLEFDAGSLKALLRANRLQGLLSAVLTSSLSGRLSAFNSGKISGLINQIYPELLSYGTAGWENLMQQGRLTDLLTAIAASKVTDKLLGENEDALRQAARSIAAVAHDLRSGSIAPLPELVERLNKGK